MHHGPYEIIKSSNGALDSLLGPLNQERRKPDVDPCCRVVVYHPQKPVDYSDVKIRKDMKF